MASTNSARRQADLFYADLMGQPLPRARARTSWPRPTEEIPHVPPPMLEESGFDEAVPNSGRGTFRHAPLGTDPGDNVEARFNVDAATPGGTAIDLVVYLHGYGAVRPDFLARKADTAGLDMLDATGAVRIRATRPTLALVPRGRHTTGATWLFDALGDAAAFDALTDAGLAWLAGSVLRLPAGSGLTRGRVTLMAHSGGGAGLSRLLARKVNPDEVVCFDSMYGPEDSIQQWALARIASPDAPRSGLRVFYTGCGSDSWGFRSDNKWHLTTTEVAARRLAHAIDRAVSRAPNGAALARRFTVERTGVAHSDIPARYSPLLLEDIQAAAPRATPAPPATERPACVANADWLTARPRRPGGEDPPRPAGTPELLEDVEDLYTAPDARPFTASSSAALFRAAPRPVAVSGATQWPEASTAPDGAAERALRTLGVTAAGVAGFAGAGLAALRPIASVFGEAALLELFSRLRYTPAQLSRPPHSFANDAALTRAFGRGASRAAILAIRTLLAIPGHFRELARRAGTEPEAYALENLGWLLMQSLRNDVRTGSTMTFWLPASPAFVTPFANPLPSLSPQTAALIAARNLIDPAAQASVYTARFDAWRTGAPGRMWRLETGRETSAGTPAGAPFYPSVFTIPAPINIAAPRAQVEAAWTRRVAAFDAGSTTTPLTQCDNAFLTPLQVMGPVSLRGLQLHSRFPSPDSAALLPSLTGLAAVAPAFEGVFQAMVDLGWNDLLVETQGMGCFRGIKIPGSPAAARRMSQHSLGVAIDVNVFENGQNTVGSMDPRIVALFEAFRFRWGKAFSTPDPMHFEYAG
jgi:D-alanyl-D-alanine carboxypeptidase